MLLIRQGGSGIITRQFRDCGLSPMSRTVWSVCSPPSCCRAAPCSRERTRRSVGASRSCFPRRPTDVQRQLREGDRYYEILESRYPFGKYAHQAQLNVAYAYYKDSQPESALAAADRFIKLHPQHPSTAYAYYLRGLVNFNRSLGFSTASCRPTPRNVIPGQPSTPTRTSASC